MKVRGVAAILKLKMAAKKNKQLLIQWNYGNAWYRKFSYCCKLNSYALPTKHALPTKQYCVSDMPRLAAILKSNKAAKQK